MAEKSNTFNENLLPELLPIYYKRLFPLSQFYRWISYGNEKRFRFSNREFSFTLLDDIYIRYLSFENQNEFEKELQNRNPVKIDIGPVMNIRPKDHLSVLKMFPIEKELVFDIDMTDYDEIRTCCSGAEVCVKCWKFMTIACKIIDTAMKEDFNFEHLLWVFSGRRGIHCWICDESARKLDSKARSAIAEYLDIIVAGGEGSISKVVIIDKMHHSIKRALNIIKPYFQEVCLEDQNIFGSSDGVKRLLKSIPEDSIKEEFKEYLKKYEGNSIEIWNSFVKLITTSQKSGSTGRRMKFLIEELQLVLLYPRIDINVTKGFSHLLKSPFCVHPKTGKICIPFHPNVAHKFDPTDVPTITGILEEINEFDLKNTDAENPNDRSKVKDNRKTKMIKGLLIFEEFLRKLEDSFKENKLPNKNQKQSLEF